MHYDNNILSEAIYSIICNHRNAPEVCFSLLTIVVNIDRILINIYHSDINVNTGVGSGWARGACAPHFFDWGGAIVCLCRSTFNPTFLFST